MSEKKLRVEIPPEIAAEVLFLSDRTCCVCRHRNRPVQLHHIDNDPSNSVAENLAVLCFDCHRETQIRGGFDRKLDSFQIKLYRSDWMRTVEDKRIAERQPTLIARTNTELVLRYLQMREKSEDYFYDFEADYPLVGISESTEGSEINSCITAFITQHLHTFRANATATAPNKNKMKVGGLAATAWDSLVISHSVSLFTTCVFSLEFQLASYYAGAAHPNTQTKTLNFSIYTSKQLDLHDIFKPSSDYINVLSRYCVDDLHRQQPSRWHNPDERAMQLKQQPDGWILSGAGPVYSNYERFSLKKNGVLIHFDPYRVGSYAEGKYEVFIPSHVLKPIIQEEVAHLLSWN